MKSYFFTLIDSNNNKLDLLLQKAIKIRDFKNEISNKVTNGVYTPKILSKQSIMNILYNYYIWKLPNNEVKMILL